MDTKTVSKPDATPSGTTPSTPAPSATAPGATAPKVTATPRAATTPANGAVTPAAAQASNIKQLAVMRLSASLGQIVGLMMRAPQHRQAFLGDLDWLVVPAISSNQFAVHEATEPRSGVKLPVAVVLWARVSEEVDARLVANIGKPPRLKPEEWTSGSIPWLVDAVGDQNAVGALVKALVEQRFKATGLKTFSRGADGKPTVTVLRTPSETAEQQKKLAPVT